MPGADRDPVAGPAPWRDHLRDTALLATPLIAAQLAQISIQTTDTVLLGWVGARELAAAVLATQMLYVALMFGSGFAAALMPVVAEAASRGEWRSIRRHAAMTFWLGTAYAAVMTPALLLLEPGLVATGQDPGLARMAAEFMQIAVWSLAPNLWIMTLRSLLAALGHARIVFQATLAAALVNGVVAWLLIFGKFGLPALGMRGAAIAALMSSLVSVAILVLYLRHSATLAPRRLLAGLAALRRPAVERIFALGWPIGLTVVAEVALFSASSLLVGRSGAVALAAHGIALQLASLVFMVPLGLAAAATIRVGSAFGRRDGPNLRRAALAAVLVATLFAFAGACAFVLIPGPLVGLFLDPANPQAAEVAALAVTMLAVAAAFQLADCLQAVGAGLLRGLQDTKVPSLLAILSYWGLGFPVAAYLSTGTDVGPLGVWIGLATGLATAAIALNWRFFNAIRRL